MRTICGTILAAVVASASFGAAVKVEWSGATARCTFDLGDSQALLFER